MIKKTVILVAGGTGGHVFPAITIAKELQNKNINVLFVTDKRGLKYTDEFKESCIVQDINTSSSSSRLKLYISLIKNIIKSFIYLLKNRPKLIIGFGGYPSVPFVISSQFLFIKTIIHEQNAVIGKANKLLSKMAYKIITSFENVKNLKYNNKVVYIGNPTRYENEYNNIKISNNDKFTILVFAGSQGADIFSKEIVDIICNISKIKKIKIYQQARKNNINQIKNKYNSLNIENTVNEFFENINEIYKESDLIISRSGASSIFEIIGFEKPSILIPYKKSINGDQLENAKFLESHNACIIIDEDNIKNNNNRIIDLIKDDEKLKTFSYNLKQLKQYDVTKKFVDLIIDNL